MDSAMFHTLLLIQLIATGFMTGLIWFVQVVHYPLFARVGAGQFVDYEDQHTRRTTLVVAPVMIIEALAALALLLLAPAGGLRTLAWLGALLLLVIWISTAAVQVPCHRRLARGFEPLVAHRLSGTNWIRTVAWSLRSLVAAAMLIRAVPALVG